MTIEEFDRVLTGAGCWVIVLMVVFGAGVLAGRTLRGTITIVDIYDSENLQIPPRVVPVGENWRGWVPYTIVAVYDTSAATLVTAGVKVENGTGQLYFQSGPTFDYYWQKGAVNARNEAIRVGVRLENVDVYVKMALPDEHYCEGASGSGATLAAIVAAAENMSLDNRYVVSIAVLYDGSLGVVGEASLKREAVVGAGMVLVVAVGQPIDNTEGVVFVSSPQELISLVVAVKQAVSPSYGVHWV